MKEATWHGCYHLSWQGLMGTPDAFSHPAKYARGLIQRIYRHLVHQGYVELGDTVLDPFGGVGLGAFDAMAYGLRWVGVELEPRFVALGQQNLTYWHQRYGFTGATLLQGDSRILRQVLAQAGVLGKVGCVVSSPPFQQSDNRGDRASFDRLQEAVVRDGHGHGGKLGPSIGQEYGTSPGQLGALPPGCVACVLSSPPYEGSDMGGRGGEGPGMAGNAKQRAAIAAGSPREHAAQSAGVGYGTDPAQLGNTTGTTFWDAASQIVAECAALLRPGAIACWALKPFVRAGRLVDFPGDWQRLCKHHGLVLVERIEASLVEDHGTQEGLFGESTPVRTGRKSFFRRLSERTGSPTIDAEIVLIMQKRPLGGGFV